MACEHELVAAFGGTWTDDDARSIVGFDLLDAAEVLRDRGGVAAASRTRSSSGCSTASSPASASACRGGPAPGELLAALNAARRAVRAGDDVVAAARRRGRRGSCRPISFQAVDHRRQGDATASRTPSRTSGPPRSSASTRWRAWRSRTRRPAWRPPRPPAASSSPCRNLRADRRGAGIASCCRRCKASRPSCSASTSSARRHLRRDRRPRRRRAAPTPARRRARRSGGTPSIVAARCGRRRRRSCSSPAASGGSPSATPSRRYEPGPFNVHAWVPLLGRSRTPLADLEPRANMLHQISPFWYEATGVDDDRSSYAEHADRAPTDEFLDDGPRPRRPARRRRSSTAPTPGVMAAILADPDAAGAARRRDRRLRRRRRLRGHRHRLRAVRLRRRPRHVGDDAAELGGVRRGARRRACTPTGGR